MIKLFIIYILIISSIFSESVSTTLTDPTQVQTFHEVTSKIRCICLPSLPIKSCSYNNCAVSAELKFFIENRIRAGESTESIIAKMQTGFGEEVLNDPIIKKFQEAGNAGIVNSVVYGFGDKILAEPDATVVNLTLGIAIVFGLGLIFWYTKKRKKFPD